MTQPTHFLERLARITPAEASLACDLGRDSVAVRAFLDEAQRRDPNLPESPRYGLALSGDAKPAVMLVAADGAPVTCLASGMQSEVPLIPYRSVESFARELRSRLNAAMSLRRMEEDDEDNAVMRLVKVPWWLTDEDFAALQVAVPLLVELLLECVRAADELFRADLPGPIRRRTARANELSRAWWPRYLCGVHAMMLGGEQAFSADTVVMRTATPDVYLSTRAVWWTARRGTEALDVLEKLAVEQGLMGPEQELCVAVAVQQPLLVGRVRGFFKEQRRKEGGAYLDDLLLPLAEPDRAKELAVIALLPFLPMMLMPEPEPGAAAPTLPDELSANELAKTMKSLGDHVNLKPIDVARRLHPRVAALLEEWLRSDEKTSVTMWRRLLRRTVIRPNKIPFGTLLYSSAPREALLPGPIPATEWQPEAGAAYMRDVMARLIPEPRPTTVAEAPGPNSPCPCGSGKKFKKCHGR